ncbi:mannose-1-phosphate guanylyltransferase [Paenibacillus kobensis]|uniref:mannose-1-phosphate guanylyltransferase n=1 Tax=Paenibacillus kobensis TaxID=59841 RepID=UPI000FDB621B|nr:sugar phosphate nucleotidyltransferase [Paenibacillus kobensis]
MNVVIMAGGKGTRFWPRSVDRVPKQFLSFITDETLLQQTVARFRQLVPENRLFIAAPSVYMPLVLSQLPGLLPEQTIIEPEQKDTAAAIALTAHTMLARDDDSPIVFVPADQFIQDETRFLAAIENAAHAAQTSRTIVTLGIRPGRPDTGFGYMELEPADPQDPPSIEPSFHVHRVAKFLEKPNTETAVQLISKPNVLWNSGIFVWRPSTIAYHMAASAPELWQPLEDYPDNTAAAYAAMPKLSIDYAVMEKAETIYCIPVDCGWDDIGSWSAFRRHRTADGSGNVMQGPVRLLNSEGNTVYTEIETLLIGVSDLIVVSTPHGLLVCHRSEEPRLKYWLNQTSR